MVPGNKTFERLEFLGDAVLDVYTIVNLQNMAERFKVQLFPEKLHGIKVFLLSKESLGRLAILCDLQIYVDYVTEENKNNCLKFYDSINLQEDQVRFLWFKSNFSAPKVLSDVFEALFGAIFLDGGMKAVRLVLDDVFSTFLAYYLSYFPHILLDIR